MHCTRSFLLVLLAVLSYSSYVKAAAQATNRESLHQKAFTISPDQAERLTLEASTGGAHTSLQQSSISRFSTSERWAMVTELKERVNEIKGQRRREHGVSSRADRWNLPSYKRLHNCILASLSETEDYTGLLLFGKSERDLLQQDKGFSECHNEELDVIIAVGRPFSGLIDETESESWAASTLEAYEELGNTFLYIASIGQAADLLDRFPSLIKLVLASEADVQACVKFGNEEHATILDEEDITLGGRVIGYQFDRLAGSGTVRFSNEDLEKRKIDVFSRQWETEFRIRPYGFQSLDPKSSPEDDVIISDARITCIRQATDDSEGIPIWKLFEWRPRGEVSTDETGHPLVVSQLPADQSRANSTAVNYHLGESLEGRCGENVPWDQRSDQAYVLVDNVWQLDAFEAEFGSNIWNELGSEIGIDFVVDVDTRNVVGTPLMSTDDLDARGKRDEIRHSKVLIDLRRDRTEHSQVFEALCMGVPVVYTRSGRDILNLSEIGSTHVYFVKSGDSSGFRTAVRLAVESRVEPFLAPSMTFEANKARHKALVETDWKSVVQTTDGF